VGALRAGEIEQGERHGHGWVAGQGFYHDGFAGRSRIELRARRQPRNEPAQSETARSRKLVVTLAQRALHIVWIESHRKWVGVRPGARFAKVARKT